MRIGYRNFVGGVLFAALGLLMLLWAIPYHVEPDPDLRLPVATMPKVVAVLFMLLGGLLAFKAVVGTVSVKPEKPSSEPNAARMLGVFGLIAAATMAMIWLPYLVVMPVLAVALALVFGSRRLTRIVPVAFAPVLIFLFVRYGFERFLP